MSQLVKAYRRIASAQSSLRTATLLASIYDLPPCSRSEAEQRLAGRPSIPNRSCLEPNLYADTEGHAVVDLLY